MELDKILTNIEREALRITKARERYKRQQESSKHLKYSIYYQQERQNKNKFHTLLDGKIFKTKDPYLYAIYPPNCKGCNCRMDTLSERQLKNQNGVVLDVKEYLLSLLKSGDITIDEIKEMEKFDPR